MRPISKIEAARQIIDLVKELTQQRLTIKEMAKNFSVSERSVYRLMVVLEELEIPIEVGRDKRYFIASDYCPFCDRPTTTNEVDIDRKDVLIISRAPAKNS